jgi:hypothetical protein
MTQALAALCGALLLAGNGPADHSAAQVRGDYIEARTADIYTGPCFANAEIYTTGHQAVVAWKVTEGSWEGQDLAGLCVAAAVRGSTTLGLDEPARARAVLIVDESATPAQRDALVSLAKALGGDRLAHVEGVRTAMMNVFVEDHHDADAPADAHHKAAPRGSFWAPGLAEVLTRPLDDGDHFCGNEGVEYPPLSEGVTALPSYTLGHKFRGEGLGTTWDDPNCRSSFVGHFAY